MVVSNVEKSYIKRWVKVISNIAKELCQTLGKCSFQRQAIDSNMSDYQGKKNIVGGRSVVEGWSIPQHRTPDKSLLLRNIAVTGGRWSKKQHIAHAHTRVNITRKMRATGILWLLYQTFQEIPEHQDCKRILLEYRFFHIVLLHLIPMVYDALGSSNLQAEYISFFSQIYTFRHITMVTSYTF